MHDFQKNHAERDLSTALFVSKIAADGVSKTILM